MYRHEHCLGVLTVQSNVSGRGLEMKNDEPNRKPKKQLAGAYEAAQSRSGVFASSRALEAAPPAPVDLERETVVPFTQVAKLGIIPTRRKGARLNLRTLHRWASTGVKGVILPSLLVGAQRVTSVEALLRFFEAVSAKANRRSESAKGGRTTSGPDLNEELDRLGL